MNTVPYEVLAAPYTLYIASVGTTFPDVDETPGVSWFKVGTSGNLNYDDGAGVTIEHPQTIVKWRSVGDAGSRKVFRTEEDLIVRMVVVDMTLEQYALAINNNTVTDTPAGVGTPGTRKLGLSRGFQVSTKALLIKGHESPYGEDWTSQYEIPVAAQAGSPTVTVSKKGQPAALALEWHALVDPNAASEDERFGRLIAQDADALT